MIPIESTPLAVSLEVLNVSEVSGNANITHSRGKVRYLYEYTIELAVEVTPAGAGAAPLTATVKVEDCINDQLEDVVVSISWATSPPSGNIHFVLVIDMLIF